MKKILLFICLFVSVQSFSQTIPGYNTRTVREKLIAMSVDSGLHIPRYNGAPSGLRVGVYVADGQIAMDTTNHRLYIYSGGAWVRMASFAEVGSTYTANLPIRVTGTVISADTSVAFSPSLTTNARLQKIVDSIYGVGFINIYNSDGTITGGNRTVTMGSNNVNFSSGSGGSFEANSFSGGALGSLSVDNAASTIINSQASSNSGISLQAAQSMLYSQLDGRRSDIIFYPDSIVLKPGMGNLRIDSIDYNSDANLVSVVQDTTNGHIYRKTITGGSGSNFANADLTFTADRFHELDDNQLEIANQAGNQLLIDPVGRRYMFGDVAAAGNGRALIILDTVTVTDAYRMPAMQEATTSKAVFYNTTTGGLTYDDAPSGVSDGDKGDITVSGSGATWTYSPANKVRQWGQYHLDVITGGNHYYQIASSGTGSAVTRPGTAIADNWFGGLQYSTGTTSTGIAYSYLANGSTWCPIAISNSYRYNIAGKIRFEDLSDGTEWYTILFGFSDNGGMGSNTDAVCFTYSHSQSSGQFVCHTKSNGSTTSTASGVTVAADTDYELEISVFGGSAYFWINGTLVHTETLTIPTGTARATGGVIMVEKLAGTTARLVYLEYMATGKR